MLRSSHTLLRPGELILEASSRMASPILRFMPDQNLKIFEHHVPGWAEKCAHVLGGLRCRLLRCRVAKLSSMYAAVV